LGALPSFWAASALAGEQTTLVIQPLGNALPLVEKALTTFFPLSLTVAAPAALPKRTGLARTELRGRRHHDCRSACSCA